MMIEGGKKIVVGADGCVLNSLILFYINARICRNHAEAYSIHLYQII